MRVAHYASDVSGDVVGTIHGPDRYGAFYEAVGAVYDLAQDRTTVEFRALTPDDTREARYDEWGQLRVVTDE